MKIKIYCENGAMTKQVKELKNIGIELIGFPFENFNRKVTRSNVPSMLTIDTTFITIDDTRISNTDKSDVFDKIANVVGRNNFNDVRHIDTAYKENCKIFLSPDKGDIINKADELQKLTGIQFFHCQDIHEIKKAIQNITKQ